jgi:THO complex subunit 1
MSIDDVPSTDEVRDLIDSHLRKYIQSRRKAGSDAAVTENECADLAQQLIELKIQSESTQLAAARLDSIFRHKFVTVVDTTSISDPSFQEVWILIDLITILSDNEVCERGLNFLLIEELLDSQTIDGCRKIFDFLEPRRERMTAKYWTEKKLVILRCCNELLRRLSRAEDTVFCGRVYIYLFQSFPLGERSSVNLRGEFHTDNITTFDPSPQKSDNAIKPMEIDTDGTQQIPSGAQTPVSTAPDSDSISKTGQTTPLPRPSKSEPKVTEAPPDLDVLYPKFWSLQSLFSSPTRLFEPSSMAQFKEGLVITLSCFRSISSTASSSTPAPPAVGSKRKHSQFNGTASSATPFNPKYLTNRDLFDLEIHDLAFRRHILVQSLIMLDFLLSLSPTSKSKYSDLITWVPPAALTEDEKEKETEDDKARKITPNKSVLHTFTLSADDEKWCTDTRRQISSYLQSQGPGNEGKFYSRMVETVLSRDKNWVRWKAESCPLITRKPVGVNTHLNAQNTLVDITQRTNRPLTQPPGAADFSFLNTTTSLESLKKPSKRFKLPTLREYYEKIQVDELDMDFATEAEKKEIEERKAGKVWRALRASVGEGRSMGVCEKLYPRNTGGEEKGWNLRALIGEDEEEERGQVRNEEEGQQDGVKSNTQRRAAGTPAAIEEVIGTPVGSGDGAADDDVPEAVKSPNPQHVAALPVGTEEEETPSPDPVGMGFDSDQGAVQDTTADADTTAIVDGEVQAAALAGGKGGEDQDGAVDEDEDGGENGDEDEVMDDFAPGGMDDAEAES